MPGNASLLSQLAALDALLNQKEMAISEAKQAPELLPIFKDALFAPPIMVNLASASTQSRKKSVRRRGADAQTITFDSQ